MNLCTMHLPPTLTLPLIANHLAWAKTNHLAWAKTNHLAWAKTNHLAWAKTNHLAWAKNGGGNVIEFFLSSPSSLRGEGRGRGESLHQMRGLK